MIALSNPSNFDVMIESANSLVESLRKMQIDFHIKTTKSAARKNEALWDSIARKNSKQDRSH